MVIGVCPDLLAVPVRHRRFSDCRFPVADFQPHSLALPDQKRHRQELDAKFVDLTRLDWVDMVVLEKRPHVGGQIRVFGAVRGPQPALADFHKARLLFALRQQRELDHHVHVALVGRGVERQHALARELAIPRERGRRALGGGQSEASPTAPSPWTKKRTFGRSMTALSISLRWWSYQGRSSARRKSG